VSLAASRARSLPSKFSDLQVLRPSEPTLFDKCALRSYISAELIETEACMLVKNSANASFCSSGARYDTIERHAIAIEAVG